MTLRLSMLNFVFFLPSEHDKMFTNLLECEHRYRVIVFFYWAGFIVFSFHFKKYIMFLHLGAHMMMTWYYLLNEQSNLSFM